MDRLTLASMARYYGVFPATIRHHIRAGRLPEPSNTTLADLVNIPYPSSNRIAKGPGIRGGTVAARRLYGVSRFNRRLKHGERSALRGAGMPVVRREHILMAMDKLKARDAIKNRLDLIERKIDIIVKHLIS